MSDLERRHSLTFEQAEGLVSMPTQTNVGELGRAARARLWQVVHSQLSMPGTAGPYSLPSSVAAVLRDEWVHREHNFADDFSTDREEQVDRLRQLFERGSYGDVLGFVQFWLRHESRTSGFAQAITTALSQSYSAYRVFEGRTIAPITSDANAVALKHDLQVVAAGSAPAVATHLQAAAAALNTGEYASAVRESIHAVDAAARPLAPDAKDLGPALTALSSAGYIHGAMKTGFAALYGYASDEKGVRHSLLFESKANVTEADALFMFGACAAFCAYLIAKGREVG